MAGNLSPANADNIFAAVDIGTHSFKLIIVRANPKTSRFLTIDRIKSPVVLGREALISSAIQFRAIAALRQFQLLLRYHRVPPSHTRIVATSAVREASNQLEFLSSIHQTLGLEIEVLSGEEEARLIYIGVLQFLPIFKEKSLIIDIGGGSTEFVIGARGRVISATSLRLGHVTLTEEFKQNDRIDAMREHIRNVIQQSGLLEKVCEHGFNVVIGSSGIIRAIENAICNGYEKGSTDDLRSFEWHKRDWKFSRGELGDLVEWLHREDGEKGSKVERERVFKRRSEFIVAGAVLLEEIFGMLSLEEMEVSKYSLGEGLIAEKLAFFFSFHDLNADEGWHSVVRLASRLNRKKKMKSSASCAGIAKEIFDGIRTWNEMADGGQRLGISLDDKALEYLEAACLLHSIGLVTGKKGYHKQSYHIIREGGHLRAYDFEEIKIIALLAKHHRKKFPKLDQHSLLGFTEEVKQRFRILCAILRVSLVVQQDLSVNIQDFNVSHSEEGFKLVLSERCDQTSIPVDARSLPVGADRGIMKELEQFKEVFHQKLTVIFSSSSSES